MMHRSHTHARVNRVAGSWVRVGAEVLLDRFSGRFRALPDVDPAGYLHALPLGDPDDPVVHDELQGLGQLVEAEVAPGRIIQDLLAGALLGRQVLRRPFGGDVEVERVLTGGPVGDDRSVAAELRHDATITLEVVRGRGGEGRGVVGEPGPELCVIGLVVLRYLLSQLLEILETQFLQPHRDLPTARGGPWARHRGPGPASR